MLSMVGMRGAGAKGVKNALVGCIRRVARLRLQRVIFFSSNRFVMQNGTSKNLFAFLFIAGAIYDVTAISL